MSDKKDLVLYELRDLTNPSTGENLPPLPVTAQQLYNADKLDDYVDYMNSDIELLHMLNNYGWRYVDAKGWQPQKTEIT